MRSLLVVAALVGPAHAQPAPYPDPLPSPAPPVQPIPPPPTTSLVPPLALDADEVALLEHGEITEQQYFVGGFANVFVGFGLGQAIQHRWFSRGWIFTLGEGVSLAAVIIGVLSSPDCTSSSCDGRSTLGNIGLFGLLGFHIWGAIDSFAAPANYNRRVRELRSRLGIQQMYSRIVPFVSNRTAGVAFRF
jgi:hypothetical protein